VFCDAPRVITEGGLAGLDVSLVSPHLAKGENDLTQVLPLATLTAIDELSGYTQSQKDLVTSAEAMLVLAYVIPTINLKAGADGGLVVSQAYPEGSGTTYMSQREAQKRADNFRYEALRILGQFKTANSDTRVVRAGGFRMYSIENEA
jgi:hypothetical protein